MFGRLARMSYNAGLGLTMTLSRVDLRFRHRPLRLLRSAAPEILEIGEKKRNQAHAFRHGLVIIGLLTIGFLSWLVVHWVFRPPWLSVLPDVVTEFVALVETAGAFTLAFLWAGLGWRYWRRLQPSEPHLAPRPTLAALQTLSPREFENYVAWLFRQKGYKVIMRGGSGDLGVDLELTGVRGRRAIVQCKRYQNTIGAEIIRELYGTLIHEGVHWAFLVTTAEISDAAREWASGKPITLIDGSTLVEVAHALGDKRRPAAAASLDVTE